MSSSYIYGHTIAQVEPPLVGIHLLWMGPHRWIYSTQGWFIQRRKYKRRTEETLCETIDEGIMEQLSVEGERRLRFGTVTMHLGEWPTPVVQEGHPEPIMQCKVFTLELDQASRVVYINTRLSSRSFAIGLYREKVVAVNGPFLDDSSYELRSFAIDKVVVYWINQYTYLEFCIPIPEVDEAEEWNDVPYIVKDLQLPIQELDADLSNPDDELAEARSRLITDSESIDENQFKRLIDSLRICVKNAGPPRPIDQVLLLRNNRDDRFEELTGLDPLRMLISQPKWRRILGFGWFDSDPSLEIGETYEYRITGFFPSQDIYDTVYGFHTIPSKTVLPAEFFLGGLRLQVPQPVVVELAPPEAYSDLIQISRRGISLRPLEQTYWLWRSIEDWSLIIDFPAPTRTVTLELLEGHQLLYSGGFPWSRFIDQRPVPATTNPTLNFSNDITQLRLRGNAFLFAIRLPSGHAGVNPFSVLLPPVTLSDTPRPQPPLTANITNLQQPKTISNNNIPPSIILPRHDLGFEIQWRPALRNGLAIWPRHEISAPPLDAAIFQLERREMIPDNRFSSKMRALMTAMTVEINLPSTSQFRKLRDISPELLNAIDSISISRKKRKALVSAIVSDDLNTISRILFVPVTEWKPVLSEENYVLGNRNKISRWMNIFPGMDLMYLYPELPVRPPDAGLDIFFRDVFTFGSTDEPLPEAVPAPGTYHQYRIAAVDQIGRPSLTHRESNIQRLEKHDSPPVPVGAEDPDTNPADEVTLPQPTGVQARILVKDSPDLTSDDKERLMTSSNVIILTWGWHERQRRTDPFAKEFRIYIARRPLDSVSGTLTSVATLPPGDFVAFVATISLDRPIAANAVQGTILNAGYPFYVSEHTGGVSISATLLTTDRSAVPTVGPIDIPLPFTPDQVHPQIWSERLEIKRITDATKYEALIRDKLNLDASHPIDSVWVGVSSADDQFYVEDQLAPRENRKGNESAIVPVLCTARYKARIELTVPPPLDPVPVFMTPEPTGRPILFTLDLSRYLTGIAELGPHELVRPERVAADSIFEYYYLDNNNRIMARVVDRRDSTDTDREVIVPNPEDRAKVIEGLGSARTDTLEDRFIIFLAGSHPYRDRLFEPAVETPVELGPFRDTVPPKAGRYVYRVRKADIAGNLSAGGAVAKVIVRVPSLFPGAAPERLLPEINDTPGFLKLRIPQDRSVTHLLFFTQTFSAEPVGVPTAPDLLRVPNAANQYPDYGIILRAADGSILTPNVKSLSDSDVSADTNGFKYVNLRLSAKPGMRIRVWACTLTNDGIPSLLGGGWGLPMPLEPLPTPSLNALRLTPVDIVFSWSWQSTEEPVYEVVIERTKDEIAWQRVSGPINAGETTYSYTASPGRWTYRLRILDVSGRDGYSNLVTIGGR